MQKKNTKPLPVTKIRAILPEKVNVLKIDSKQMLRDVVTDYLVQNIYSANPLLSKRHKQLKYQSFMFSLIVNGCNQSFQIQIPALLQKYTQREKQRINNQVGLEPLIKDILNFIDKLESNAQFRRLDVEGTISLEKMLDVLMARHARERDRKAFQGQYEEAKENIYAKYKKVDFQDFQQHTSSKVTWKDFQQEEYQNCSNIKSKNAISILLKDEFNHKKKQVPTKSKLKQLVDSCNIFQHPQKVEALRQEKLVNYFCKSEKELLDARFQIRKIVADKQVNKNVGHLASLEDWIAEISLSEHLFKKKYEPQVQKKGEKNKKEPAVEGLSSSDEDDNV